MLSADRMVLTLSGLAIIVGFALTALMSHHWIWLTIAASANLVRASASGYCPIAIGLHRLGLPAGRVFDYPRPIR